MGLNKLEKRVLGEFRIRVQTALQDQEMQVKLFGSKARGEGRKDSDLDVLVIVSGDDWHLCDRVYEVATDLLLETGVCISPKIVSVNQYHQLLEENAPFVRNVIRDAVAI